jgi:hypothetical protein
MRPHSVYSACLDLSNNTSCTETNHAGRLFFYVKSASWLRLFLAPTLTVLPLATFAGPRGVNIVGRMEQSDFKPHGIYAAGAGKSSKRNYYE